MGKTLYISDLDGTLLNPNGDLSEKTVETINGLINQGLAFTYATARSFTSASKKTAPLNLKLPVILNNGTFIADVNTGKPLFYRTLDKCRLGRIRDLVRLQKVGVLVYALFDGVEKVAWILGAESQGIKNYLNERKGDMRFRPVTDYSQLFEGDVFYLAFIDEYQHMCNIKEQLEYLSISGEYSVIMQEDSYTSGEYWVEGS